MTDERSRDEEPEFEHDEYHSALEIDDTTGWRPFIVIGLIILFLVTMVGLFFVYQGDMEPDPRIADRLREQQEEAAEDEAALEPALPPAGDLTVDEDLIADPGAEPALEEMPAAGDVPPGEPPLPAEE
ncbi:MAG: hypothetical protein ACFBQW_09480 [Sphingomonadaceae bacterium]